MTEAEKSHADYSNIDLVCTIDNLVKYPLF